MFMKDKKIVSLLVIMAITFLAPSLGVRAETADPVPPDQAKAEAMAIVDRMAEFLSQAKGFSVTAYMGFDAVQESGQKIEFGETRKIVLDRPDRLRVDAVKRSG